MPVGKERAWTEWTETKAKIRKKAAATINIFLLFLFLLIFAFVSVHSVHALSFPAGITNYVALNISNSQSTATPNSCLGLLFGSYINA